MAGLLAGAASWMTLECAHFPFCDDPMTTHAGPKAFLLAEESDPTLRDAKPSGGLYGR